MAHEHEHERYEAEVEGRHIRPGDQISTDDRAEWHTVTEALPYPKADPEAPDPEPTEFYELFFEDGGADVVRAEKKYRVRREHERGEG